MSEELCREAIAWMTPGGDVSRSYLWCAERCRDAHRPIPLFTRANAGDWDKVKWGIAALKYMAQNGGVELDVHELSIDCSKLADKLTAALPEIRNEPS